MDTHAAARELALLLKNEIHSLEEFLQLLLTEQDSLATGARDKVGAQMEDKTRVLQKLTRYTRQRGEILRAQQCAANSSGMQTWLNRVSADTRAEIEGLWQSLLRLTQRAFQVNRTNGVLIESGLRANQGAIGVLCAAVNLGQVYGHDGRPQPRLGARQWAVA